MHMFFVALPSADVHDEHATAQSALRATLPSILLIVSLTHQRTVRVALRSGCADAQADLELHRPHMFDIRSNNTEELSK